MKMRIGFLAIITILLSGCSLTASKSGIEIISYPAAKVFINGKEAGMTPYKNNSLKPGEVEVKLSANDVEWTKTIHLENGANTVINREFSKISQISGGYILHFESTGNKDKAGLLISTKPDRSTVSLDDEIKGYSPLRLEDVTEGDKKLVVSFPGHKSVNSYVKFVNGFQLVVEADLPTEENTEEPTPTAAETSNAGNPTSLIKKIMILNTETGWLRVRNSASSSGAEVARVKPGETYSLLETGGEWYKIDLGKSVTGWILAKYGEIMSE